MLIDLGLIEAAAGETASLTRFEEALSSLDEPAERARALHALGQTLFKYGRHAEAAIVFRRGATMLEEHDREQALGFESNYMCCALFLHAECQSAMARLQHLTEPIRARTDRTPAERPLLAVAAYYRAIAGPGTAAEHARLLRDALGDGALLREQTSESLVLTLVTMGLACSGCADEAERLADEVLADARRRGAALAFMEASAVRAQVLYERGRLVDAIADAQVSLDGMGSGWQAWVPLPQAYLALSLIERGALDEADEVLAEATRYLAGNDSHGINTFFHFARGSLRLVRGDARAAFDDFRTVGELLEPHGVTNPLLLSWRSQAGLAAHALGDTEQALALVEQEIALAEAFDLPAALGRALRARGRLEDGPAALATYEQAAAALEGTDAPLELAHALFDLGGAHRRAGRPTAAREPLRRAVDLARACGATLLEEQSHDELVASGARPRRPMSGGIDSLTPSELRVAKLAASGVTNRAIAETLFVTKNTVEWHLRHVFRKLDVTSRAELDAALGQASTT
jgi:ATP/maltotriose-dependent transcriptional regulator MalT